MQHVESFPIIYRNFFLSCQRNPRKLALVTERLELDYASVLNQVDCLAKGMLELGIKSGDHIGVLLPNCAEFVILLLASARIGSVIVPQSMGLSSDAVSASFASARVQHFVVWSGVDLSLPDHSEPLASVRIVVGGARSGWQSLEDMCNKVVEEQLTIPLVCDDAPFLVVLTSGSTGAPKPIVLSQRTKLLRAQAVAELYGVTHYDVTLAATPLYHSLAQRLVLMPLMSGGTSILMSHFSPKTWIDIVRQRGVSFSIAVSTQLKQIVETLITTGETLPSLRSLVSSSALLDSVTKAKLIASLPCQFHECYGTSEIAIATSLSPTASSKRNSVGRAVQGADIRILGKDGLWVSPGTPGEIVCRTTMLFSGYLDLQQLTFDAMYEGYFRTGDLGRMDTDGDLYFLGRIKDIIISGGINIYPKDIEDVINAIIEVEECAAIPLQDDQLGEVVGVVVVMRDPIHAESVRQLHRVCALLLGDHQQPRSFFFVDALPHNAMGKLDKAALRMSHTSLAKVNQL